MGSSCCRKAPENDASRHSSYAVRIKKPIGQVYDLKDFDESIRNRSTMLVNQSKIEEPNPENLRDVMRATDDNYKLLEFQLNDTHSEIYQDQQKLIEQKVPYTKSQVKEKENVVQGNYKMRSDQSEIDKIDEAELFDEINDIQQIQTSSDPRIQGSQYVPGSMSSPLSNNPMSAMNGDGLTEYRTVYGGGETEYRTVMNGGTDYQTCLGSEQFGYGAGGGAPFTLEQLHFLENPEQQTFRNEAENPKNKSFEEQRHVTFGAIDLNDISYAKNKVKFVLQNAKSAELDSNDQTQSKTLLI